MYDYGVLSCKMPEEETGHETAFCRSFGRERREDRSDSSRAGLVSSVSHKDKQLCKGKQTACIAAGAPVCLVPVLQHLTYETVDMDKEISEQHISPLRILQTVKRYSELKKLLAGITICKAGAHQRKKSVASPLKKRNVKQSAIRRVAHRSVTFKCEESRNSCPTLARQGLIHMQGSCQIQRYGLRVQ